MFGESTNDIRFVGDLAARELVRPDDESTNCTRSLDLQEGRGLIQIRNLIEVVFGIGDRNASAGLRRNGSRLDLAGTGPIGFRDLGNLGGCGSGSAHWLVNLSVSATLNEV